MPQIHALHCVKLFGVLVYFSVESKFHYIIFLEFAVEMFDQGFNVIFFIIIKLHKKKRYLFGIMYIDICRDIVTEREKLLHFNHESNLF